MAHEKPKDHQLVAVVEALNETLCERYFGVTILSSDHFLRRLAAGFPLALAHWRPDHVIVVNFLHYALPQRDAMTFIARCRGVSRTGWTDIQEQEL